IDHSGPPTCQPSLFGRNRSPHSSGPPFRLPAPPPIPAAALAPARTAQSRVLGRPLEMHAPDPACVPLSTETRPPERPRARNARRRAEVELHAPHHPDDAFAVLAFGELGVVDAGKAQVVGAAALEEFEIAGVVDDAGEVGVGEIDARLDAMA